MVFRATDPHTRWSSDYSYRGLMTIAPPPTGCDPRGTLGGSRNEDFGPDLRQDITVIGMATKGDGRYMVSESDPGAAPARCDPRYLVTADVLAGIERSSTRIRAALDEKERLSLNTPLVDESRSVALLDGGRVVSPRVPDRASDTASR